MGSEKATPPAQEGGEEEITNIQMLDEHINSLPPEIQSQLEDGFIRYDDLPELFGIILPEAYEYFKLVQEGVRNKPQQQNSPEAAPMAQPSVEQAPSPLLGSAEPPAKATSGLLA